MTKRKLTGHTLKAGAGRKSSGARGSKRSTEDDRIDFDLYSDENRTSFEAEDQAALFRMLMLCALFRRPLPE